MHPIGLKQAYLNVYPTICSRYSHDSAHDAWISAMKWLDKPGHAIRDHSEPNLEHWLTCVALNAFRTDLRQELARAHKYHPMTEAVERKAVCQEPAMDATMIREERYESIYKALNHLRPIEREIILAYADGEDNKDIGRRLGISAVAVRLRTFRIVKKLRASLVS